MFFYDKNNNLVTVSNSILKYFTGMNLNSTCEPLDNILKQKNYKKIVVMLFDGLGTSIREKHLSPNDFLRKKEKFTITSVFPPTTVAATTAFLTGLYPNQSGWLGWRQYFKQHDVIVEMFTNKRVDTDEKLNGPHLSYMYCGYESIIDHINQNSNIKAYSLYPKNINPDGAEDLNDFFIKADKYMKQDDSHFIYMYWPEPDHQMHDNGVDSQIVKANIKQINKRLCRLAKENKDNLIIVLADHALVDTKFFHINEHQDFKDCLTSITSLESRSCFFHVKQDKISEFSTIFDKYYGKYFILKTKEEVIKEKVFGEGENHPLFEDFLGDFMATSISEYGFNDLDEDPFIGAHAGSLEEESLISVSIINQ